VLFTKEKEQAWRLTEEGLEWLTQGDNIEVET
jgi:hypothetical protein